MFSLRKSQVGFICKLLWDIQRGSKWKRCGTCGLWSWRILLWGINHRENDCFSGVLEPKRRQWTTALLQKYFGSLRGSIHQFLFMGLLISPDKFQWSRNHAFLMESSFFSFKIWLLFTHMAAFSLFSERDSLKEIRCTRSVIPWTPLYNFIYAFFRILFTEFS